MKTAIRILPHLTIILSIMFLTFWILDYFNPMMSFLDNSISHVLLFLFCLLSLVTSILLIALERKQEDMAEEERKES